ncbi:hypothetical protein BDZ89DRAFT_570144 [Hymenopellis radicata]|nr:hypothetical protein BDZ89DRAFT_570144 [Hymenopellis radicata]
MVRKQTPTNGSSGEVIFPGNRQVAWKHDLSACSPSQSHKRGCGTGFATTSHDIVSISFIGYVDSLVRI